MEHFPEEMPGTQRVEDSCSQVTQEVLGDVPGSTGCRGRFSLEPGTENPSLLK